VDLRRDGIGNMHLHLADLAKSSLSARLQVNIPSAPGTVFPVIAPESPRHGYHIFHDRAFHHIVALRNRVAAHMHEAQAAICRLRIR